MSNKKNKKNNKNTVNTKDVLLAIDEMVEEDYNEDIDYEMDIEDESFDNEDSEELEEDDDVTESTEENNSNYEDEDDEPSLSKFTNKKGDIYKYNIEKYNDNYSSAIIFGAFSIIEIVIIILSFCKVFGIFQTTIQKILLVVIAAGFGYMTFYSYKEAKKYKKGITKEEKRIETVRKFFDEVATEEYLKQFDTESSKEENYLKRVEGIKNVIINEHPDWSIDFIERVIDDYFEG
ncbi:MAG: hypothetical protein K6G26_04790 [Lachnospiraceae bacterium]|nr:hypothetical protein [Lachnospiraceae bacterium]